MLAWSRYCLPLINLAVLVGRCPIILDTENLCKIVLGEIAGEQSTTRTRTYFHRVRVIFVYSMALSDFFDSVIYSERMEEL
jgi:hypothetical protein